MDNLALTESIRPNGIVSSQMNGYLRIGWLVTGAIIWVLFKPAVMPDPIQVIQSLPSLWSDGGLREALTSSFITSTQALLISTMISLPLAYLSRIPIIRPVSIAVGQLRFLSPAVFFIILLFLLGSPHAVKIAMLVLGESFFLVTTMVAVVQQIPNESFDEARVLRMNDWHSVWYVVIRGTLADAIEAIRNNQAMGWSMLMMVEGALRSEGGVGVLALNQERFMKFDGVYGIALSILLVGIAVDWALGQLKSWACPHTART